MDVLLEQAKLQTAGANYFAAIRRFCLIDEAKDRRFTCAVATYQAGMLTGIDLKRSAA
jgi:hypothetical protein